jgi:hypothetical protein
MGTTLAFIAPHSIRGAVAVLKWGADFRISPEPALTSSRRRNDPLDSVPVAEASIISNKCSTRQYGPLVCGICGE